MIGKKVRVFWPVDSSWYTGTVKQYDPASGEHLLEYHDGDTEWVKIGENNTTGAGASPSGVEAEDLKRDRSEMMMHHPAERQHPHHSKWSTAITTTGAAGDGAPSPPSGYGPPPGNPYYPPSAGPYGGHPSPPSHPPPPPGAGGAANGGGGPPYGVPPSMMPPPYGMMYPVPYGAPPMYQGYGGAGPPGGPGGSHAPHKTEEKSPTGSADGGFGKRKTGPKAWSKHEDELLLNIVHSMQWPMKWTVVAQSLPDRTGKQCRERYVNHLNPRLKVSDWSLQEDATVFHLYNLIGSHWAKMSKIIPGRTDNGIKNRFHNIRRQYEREDEHRLRLSSSKDFPEEIRLSRLRPMPKHLLGNSAKLWDMEAAIGVLAAQSVLDGNSTTNRGSAGRFGPFRQPQAGGELCVRCGFMVPSLQTGREICSKTGWCQSCTLIPLMLVVTFFVNVLVYVVVKIRPGGPSLSLGRNSFTGED